MSISHSTAFRMLMKHKKLYDPTTPRDYIAEQRKEADAPARRQGRSMSCKLLEIGQTRGEYISMLKNPSDKLILYIHGGGFVSGTAKSRRMITQYIVKKMGFNVVSIDYRLAPAHPFPAAPEDCFSAYLALEKKYGGENIILMGESAGGNLVLSVALQARDKGVSLPAGVVAISPVVQYDRVLSSHRENLSTDCIIGDLSAEVRDIYLQTSDPAVIINPYAAPLHGQLHGFPATWLIASESEVLRDDAILFHKKLEQAGCESHLHLYPDLMHAFAIIPGFPESKRALRELQPFLDQKLGR